MAKRTYSKDLGRKLLKESGYRIGRPVFSDPDAELTFLAETWERSDETWTTGIKVILPLSSLMIGAHWLFASEVAPGVRVMEVVLVAFFVLLYFLEIRRVPARWRALIGLGMTLIGQFVCIAIFAFAIDPKSIVSLGYLAVIVGCLSPNRLAYQVVAGILPAASVVAIIYAQDIFVGRFAVHHIFMAALFAGISIALCIQQSASSRITFLLGLRANEALDRSDRLLTNVLPAKIAERMKDMPELDGSMVESFDDVTVLFADLVGFTTFTASHSAERTVRMLSDVFRRFDAIAAQCGIEKIKTIGDAYMAVAGLPDPCPDHTARIAEAALEMREALKKYCSLMGISLELRIGIHRGPVIAGIIGTQKFLYDLWGDTVNLASRLESHGLPNQIQVSEQVADVLAATHELTERGEIDIKGKGVVRTFILERPKALASAA